MSVEPSETDLVAEITLSDDKWNAAISDIGDRDPEDKIRSNVYKAADNKKYKKIWIAANELFTLMDQYRERFERLPKSSSKTSIVKKIGDFIYTERQLVDGVYTLSQDNVHLLMWTDMKISTQTNKQGLKSIQGDLQLFLRHT